MSTRRAVRPDAMVYRQTRRLGRLGRRRQSPVWAAVIIGVVLLIGAIVVVWVRYRH